MTKATVEVIKPFERYKIGDKPELWLVKVAKPAKADKPAA